MKGPAITHKPVIEGRIMFVTKDGCLIMNRVSDVSLWDKEFVHHLVAYDAREKGVKVLSTEIDIPAGKVTCVVEYLRAAV